MQRSVLHAGLPLSHALIIGINYPGTRFALQGCINDAERVRALLQKQYGVTNPVMMTDTLPTTHPLYPSRANVARELKHLVASCGSMEAGFVHFSGHGHLPNASGAMLVPADAILRSKRIGIKGTRELALEEKSFSGEDVDLSAMLSNEELWSIFSHLNPQASLFVLIDACHSGELLELPYVLSMSGAAGDAPACSIIRSKDRDAVGMGSVVMLSACTKQQKSADTSLEGRPTGALTFAFCEIVRSHPHLTYLALMKSLRTFMDQNLPASFHQTPQLSFSRPSDCMRPFRIGNRGIGEVRTRGLSTGDAAGVTLGDGEGSRLCDSTTSFWMV